jgi:5-methylcytosine-specific restriction endonuclease McrA
MPPIKVTSISESLYWSYANLAMAHAAVSAGAEEYSRTHFIIRSRLYSGLMKATMNLGSIVEDDRLKMILPQACSYCGNASDLSVDHLFPKSRGGPESGDNVVWACKQCNSSKGATDLLVWMRVRGEFPPLLLLRRYLKLAIKWAHANDTMDLSLTEADKLDFPFALSAIPHKYPSPPELRLWVVPLGVAD